MAPVPTQLGVRSKTGGDVLKVAIVCPYDLGSFGGVQDQAAKLTRWLRDLGHDAWLVGPGEEGPPGARLVGPVTVVSANGSATPITLSPRAWRATLEAVEGADVVHVHEPLMPVVAQAATSAPMAKVGTFHADPSRMVRRLYRAGGPILRLVTQRLDAATAVSPVAAGALGGLVSPVVVPNGLDVSSYRVGDKRPHRVAFLGRRNPRKGLDVLLRAWPAVVEAVPDAELVIAGTEGDGGADGVSYLGRVDEERKRDVLAEASVFCAPNTRGESFGITLAEAMASGCAVVASGLAGFVHVAAGAGIFVPPGDHRSLAATLIEVLSDEEMRLRSAATGLEVVTRFDAPAVTQAYVREYERALEAAE